MGAKQSVVKAAGKGNMARVKHHVNKRGRSVLFEKEPGGWTALHKAARKGQLEMVEYLVEQKADLESIDASMSTPLHCACWKGQVEVVEKLLELNANPLAVTESGWNAIHSAAFRGHAGVVKVLLQQTDINSAQRDLQGFTAVELTEVDAVAELLEEAGYRALEQVLASEEEELFLEVDGEEERSAHEIEDAGRRKGVDIYAMLGLPPNASPDDVKEAYKRMARKYAKERPSSAQRNRPSSAEAQRARQRRDEALSAADTPAALDGERVEYVPGGGGAAPARPPPVPAPLEAAGVGAPDKAGEGEGEEEDPFEKMERQLVDKGYKRERCEVWGGSGGWGVRWAGPDRSVFGSHMRACVRVRTCVCVCVCARGGSTVREARWGKADMVSQMCVRARVTA